MSDKANIAAAVLAHVDAGKTTLSEALLYESGMIRRAGRVDNKDAFLDTFALEKERGITIFSKQAVLKLPEETVTLLDTPGHVDFSAEMERTLQVLDYAILVISGADGVQAHTRTLFGLLAKYEVPVFLFVNKMDQPGTDQEALLLELKKELHENCVDFSDQESAAFAENVAVCDEQVLEQYLAGEAVGTEQIKRLIRERKLFPCYFGSALKMQGVKAFLADFIRYASIPAYGETFGARVFKIARDAQGNRLTYLKVTGGSLKVRQVIGEEKINQIRIYSGEKYETAEEVGTGGVCAVTGLLRTFPGEGLGAEKASRLPVLEPVLTYQIILPEEVNPAVMLPRLRELEEEEPQLHIVWDETLREIQVQVMGEVQIEVLSELIRQRYGVQVAFGAGRIVYKETIAGTVEGVGHFEPLRHYAEVHLLLEPGEPGSGLVFEPDCSEDVLDRNWQRLVLTHLREKEHVGVLTGSALADMKITLVAGRAHTKHTEGGDFRQATYRALRQGLMQAETVLLEPWYRFELDGPGECVGRALADLTRMGAEYEPPAMTGERATLSGRAPASEVQDYALEVAAYTSGRGHLYLEFAGYAACHDAERVIEAAAYEPEADLPNTPDSVFCSHGAGYTVKWYDVPAAAHVKVDPATFRPWRAADAEFFGHRC